MVVVRVKFIGLHLLCGKNIAFNIARKVGTTRFQKEKVPTTVSKSIFWATVQKSCLNINVAVHLKQYFMWSCNTNRICLTLHYT